MLKKSILSLTFCLISLSIWAQSSNTILFTENGEKFTAILNGIRQNDKPETNVKITGLNAEFYKLKVIFDNQALGEKNFNLAIQLGNETSYCIKKNNKGEYVIRFISSVPIAQAPPTPPTQQVVVYHTNPAATPAPTPVGSTVVHQQTTTTTTNGQGNPDNVNINMGINMNENGGGINLNVSGVGMETESSSTTVHTTTTTTTTTSNTNFNTPPPPLPAPAPAPIVYLPGYNGPIGCPIPMSPNDFSALKNTITSKTFEETRLTIAKQVVGDRCLITDQVKELLQAFTFEDSKLDIAKFAYGRTYDIGNYFKVNDVFTFESSIEELNYYIQSRK
jgi:hypothetical protein